MPVTLPTAPLTAPPPPTAPLPPAAQPPTAQPPAIARPPAGAPSVTPLPPVPVSATLAANETLARKRRDGETVLPLAFGEAGLPTHPLLRDALAAASGGNAYGPVAGLPELREAAAGYWSRRGVPASGASMVAGPGSKALLYALLTVLPGDVVLPRPSWVSYAAQAALAGKQVISVPIADAAGGVPDPFWNWIFSNPRMVPVVRSNAPLRFS